MKILYGFNVALALVNLIIAYGNNNLSAVAGWFVAMLFAIMLILYEIRDDLKD